MIDKTYDYQDDINHIVDYFDFEKVKKVMDHLHWLWFDTIGVPEIGDLRKHARSLLNQVAIKVLDSNEIGAQTYIATGGFKATAQRYDDKIYFALAFEVSSLDNYD